MHILTIKLQIKNYKMEKDRRKQKRKESNPLYQVKQCPVSLLLLVCFQISLSSFALSLPILFLLFSFNIMYMLAYLSFYLPSTIAAYCLCNFSFHYYSASEHCLSSLRHHNHLHNHHQPCDRLSLLSADLGASF